MITLSMHTTEGGLTMLLSSDERELLEIIRNQLELDIEKGTVDLSITQFNDYKTPQKEILFNSLKASGYIIEYSTVDHAKYQVKMPHDFYIAQV